MKRRKRKVPENSMPANESDWIDCLDSLMKNLVEGEKIRVVIYDRSSFETQKDNLEARRSIIMDKLDRKYGQKLSIEKYFSEIKNGRSDCLYKRTKLSKTIEYCQKHQCFLLVLSVDRLVRTDSYSKENQFSPLLERDMIRLAKLIRGVAVLSIAPPGTDQRKVRGILSAWGQEGKQSWGGRPPKKRAGYLKRLRERFEAKVWNLHRKGYSCRGISKFLKRKYGVSIPYKTIWNWICRRKMAQSINRQQ